MLEKFRFDSVRLGSIYLARKAQLDVLHTDGTNQTRSLSVLLNEMFGRHSFARWLTKKFSTLYPEVALQCDITLYSMLQTDICCS